MPSVYISCVHEDQAIARLIGESLQREGLVAFWDQSIPAGKTWDDVIGGAIRDAGAVVVLWTENSVGSNRVKEEATLAKDQGKLLPVIFGRVEQPLGFRRIQAADLTSWKGEPENAQWALVVREVQRLVSADGRAEPRRRIATEAEYAPSGSKRAASPGELGQEIEYRSAIPYKKPLRAPSTHVFVAHASDDKARIKPILEVLIRAGFPIWIDKPHLLGLEPKLAKRLRGIEFGPGDWKDQIRNAAHRAHIVMAFWSNDAIDARREQFYYEVYMGLIQRKLCQCRIDDMLPSKIGMPFTFDQIADLSGFAPGAYNPELDSVIQGLPRFRKRIF